MISKVMCIVLTILTAVAIDIATTDLTKKCLQKENIFNCSGLGILTLPDFKYVPFNIETLDVSFNNIENISLLHNHELSHSVSAFNLSHNKISTVDNEVFKFFNHTRYLDLSFNQISGHTLKDMDLSDLIRLHHLILKRNPLRKIYTDTFNFLEHPKVKHLDLSHCEIKMLERGSIDIRSLEYLDLSWNQLVALQDSAFYMMPNLKNLDLSHNGITVLNEMPNMPELVTLILDNNEIETITIKEQIEDFADNLQELYLRHNNILRFDSNSLPLQMDTLWLIDMSNNRLHCDCRMRWILNGHYNFEKKSFTFTCSYPSSNSGQNLLSLDTEKLTCGNSLLKILLIVLICSVVFLGFSVSGFFIIRSRRHLEKFKRVAREDDSGGDYTAVFTRDDGEDSKVSLSDDKNLLENDKNVEFDV